VVYPTGAGKTVPIEMGPLELCTGAVWFPDGKSLLIAGNEPGKPARAYRAAFPGGTPEALLPEGLQPRLISADGKYLLVVDESGNAHRFEIGGRPEPVKGLAPRDVPLEWSADLKFLTVADSQTLPAVVSRVNLDTGERTKIAELAPANLAGVLGVTLADFRDNGRQYSYGYARRISALYLVTGVR
jgi:hypothetical protein